MTYITHKVFAVWWVTISQMILWCIGVDSVNYYLAWIIMLYAGKSGALFPDVDHHWESVKEKTMLNRVINTIIHMTGGKHRSWQTHSIDIAFCYTLISFTLPPKLVNIGRLTEVDGAILQLLLVGFAMGWLSHLFSDMLTSAGVRILCWKKIKVSFVPKELFGLRFNTGNTWEAFVYKTTKVLNAVVGVMALVLPILRGFDLF